MSRRRDHEADEAARPARQSPSQRRLETRTEAADELPFAIPRGEDSAPETARYPLDVECAPIPSNEPNAEHVSEPAVCMSHGGRVVAVQAQRRRAADLDRFVAALLAMALDQLDSEKG
jgi:hypothetical protein